MVEKNDKDLLEFRERIAKIKSGVEVEPKPEPEPDEGDSVEEKEQLIKMLEEKGIEYDEKAKKEDLIKLLEGDEEDPDAAPDPDAEV